jgi:predicted RNase H-like HicB family nuclease
MDNDSKTAAPARPVGNPETDAGWLVSTPWLGQHMAVFGLTKEDALARAERGRSAHVAELQASVDRWTHYQLEARFVKAVTNG